MGYGDDTHFAELCYFWELYTSHAKLNLRFESYQVLAHDFLYIYSSVILAIFLVLQKRFEKKRAKRKISA